MFNNFFDIAYGNALEILQLRKTAKLLLPNVNRDVVELCNHSISVLQKKKTEKNGKHQVETAAHI